MMANQDEFDAGAVFANMAQQMAAAASGNVSQSLANQTVNLTSGHMVYLSILNHLRKIVQNSSKG